MDTGSGTRNQAALQHKELAGRLARTQADPGGDTQTEESQDSLEEAPSKGLSVT